MKGHTFIFRPGTWSARGFFWDENNAEFPLDGITRVIHEPDLWFVKGRMEVPLDPPTIIENQYEILPPTEGVPTMVWISYNPTIGRFKGTFTVVQNTIISYYASEDNEFSGAECLIMLSENTYRNEGVFFRGKRRLSSWACLFEWSDEIQ